MRKFTLAKLLFITALLLFLYPETSQASSLSQRLSGRILINVEKHGEAWYINPEDKKRYYLGRPSDAFQIMRELGLGISEKDFQQIAQVGMPVEGNRELTQRLAGQIVIRVSFHGEAWYVNPLDLRKYYLGRPDDAFQIMRELGLGITRLDLARIHKPSLDEALDEYSSYNFRKKISTVSGDYYVDLVEIDLNNPELEIVTDTASNTDCERNCPATSLGEFVIRNDGFAGINATYFDTSATKRNYYFFPVYNSNSKVLINQVQLRYWTTGPIVVFDQDNNFYYFKDCREFKSVEHFETTYNTKLQAAFGNKPRIIEQGMNLLIDWELDSNQTGVRAWRSAMAYQKEEKGKGKILLVVARNVTIPDLADILKAMKVDYALNLDGGGSTALFYNDEYMIGPGRDVPNALVFKEK